MRVKTCKYIYFEKIADDKYEVLNIKSEFALGEIVYYSRWRNFVFQPSEMTEFSPDCLRDIASFMEGLKEGRAALSKAEGETK